MNTLPAHHVLDFWERVSSCPPVERGPVILAATDPDSLVAGALTVGQCEERLLTLHEALFGSHLSGFAECPRCGLALELNVSIPELRANVGITELGQADQDVLRNGGYEVHFRLLSAADLVDAGRCATISDARDLLLRRSIVSVSRRGRRVGAGQLPKALVAQLARRLAERDPWAESMLNLVCPDCGHTRTVLLEVADFLWIELRTRARRVLRDVHTLASAYGWSEADILSMSARRREAYLELISA